MDTTVEVLRAMLHQAIDTCTDLSLLDLVYKLLLIA